MSTISTVVEVDPTYAEASTGKAVTDAAARTMVAKRVGVKIILTDVMNECTV